MAYCRKVEMKRLAKQIWIKPMLLLLFLTAMIVAWLSGLTDKFSSGEKINLILQQQGEWAPLIFLALYIGLPFLLLPPSVMTAASGFLFGPIWGAALSLSGAVIGASLAFVLARFLGRESIQKILPKKLLQLDKGMKIHGFAAVVYMRLIFVPFMIVNFSSGFSSIKFRHFFWGTVIGILPASFALPYLTGNIRRAFTENDLSLLHDSKTLGALALFVLVSSMPVIIHFIQKSRKKT